MQGGFALSQSDGWLFVGGQSGNEPGVVHGMLVSCILSEFPDVLVFVAVGAPEAVTTVVVAVSSFGNPVTRNSSSQGELIALFESFCPINYVSSHYRRP